MDDKNLNELLARFESLLDRADQWLPKKTETDWSASAFRWRPDGSMQALIHKTDLQLSDLLHVDRQKAQLDRNTQKFLQNQPANDVLLWGSRGTGKSSLIRALLNEYADQGLRLIEVDKSELINMTDIVENLRDREERFIIYSDDLSFEADDASYKTLKAVLDGSVSHRPDNVLIYATSNRRHLLPEYQSENQQTQMIDGELHHGESVEEKVSLSERFGLWLSFHPFRQEQYLDVVEHWIKKLQLEEGDTLRAEALKFALLRGSRSGRVARQFANHWASPE